LFLFCVQVTGADLQFTGAQSSNARDEQADSSGDSETEEEEPPKRRRLTHGAVPELRSSDVKELAVLHTRTHPYASCHVRTPQSNAARTLQLVQKLFSVVGAMARHESFSLDPDAVIKEEAVREIERLQKRFDELEHEKRRDMFAKELARRGIS
jgi:hypothetical protein